MDRVHTRNSDNRVVVQMNDRFQPIFDDDKISSELSNFLGTIAKRCVSFNYVTWRDVPASLKKTMWNYVRVLHTLFISATVSFIFFTSVFLFCTYISFFFLIHFVSNDILYLMNVKGGCWILFMHLGGYVRVESRRHITKLMILIKKG